MKVRRGYFTPGREHSLLTLAGRLRRQSHLRVISTFGISQGVILVTSLARIPLIVSAIGSKGYGVALAVTSLQAWMFLVLISITDLTRVSVSESLGRRDFTAVLQTVATMRLRAKQLAVAFMLFGVLLAVALPWAQLLHAERVSGTLVIRVGICADCMVGSKCSSGSHVHRGSARG